MQIKLDITFDQAEAKRLAHPDDPATPAGRETLAGVIADELGLDAIPADGSPKGGWFWKASYPQDGTVKMTGRFVAAGRAVVG